jgi:hypothetical protein
MPGKYERGARVFVGGRGQTGLFVTDR